MPGPFETILPSVARTATLNSAMFRRKGSGVHVSIDATVEADTASVVPHIQGYDEASDTWYDLLVGAAIEAVGFVVLKVVPGIIVVANLAANDGLPYMWRVRMVHADADALTYSIGANYI